MLNKALDLQVKDLNYILVAEDDEDDQELIRDALLESELAEQKLRFVTDGEELINLLQNAVLLPSLILLDLNMPRKNGFQVLSEIKTSTKLKHIPVIVFTTSDNYSDIKKCHELGGNSFMTKPPGYIELVSQMRSLKAYWFDAAQIITD
jgi:CheY-like chemotaxis protein